MGPVSLLVLPVSGQVSNVWEGVGGECMTSRPAADHYSECGHSCHVSTALHGRLLQPFVSDREWGTLVHQAVSQMWKQTHAYYSRFRRHRCTKGTPKCRPFHGEHNTHGDKYPAKMTNMQLYYVVISVRMLKLVFSEV